MFSEGGLGPWVVKVGPRVVPLPYPVLSWDTVMSRRGCDEFGGLLSSLLERSLTRERWHTSSISGYHLNRCSENPRKVQRDDTGTGTGGAAAGGGRPQVLRGERQT